MLEAPIDFEADAKENAVPTDSAIKELHGLVDQMLGLEKAAAVIEADLKACTDALRKLTESTIPERMQELGIAALTLNDGQVLEIKEDVFASIPKDHQSEAYVWLTENGFGDLIKNTFTVLPSRTAAPDLAEFLGQARIDYEEKLAVHAGTFKAFAKEQLREGRTLPDNIFSVFDYRKAVLKAPKKKR